MKNKTKVELEGVAAAAAGALGAAYYFYGTKGAAKHRKNAKAWMVKAEKEILTKAKKLQAATLNEKNYHAIVSAVSAKYQQLSKIDKKDVENFKKTLKSAWKELKKMKTATHAKRTVKKAPSKAKKTGSKKN